MELKKEFNLFFTKENMQVLFSDEYERENFWFDMLILGFIFLSCFIFILETSNSLIAYMPYFKLLDVFLNVFFSIEIFLRTYYSTNLKKHFTSTYTYIDFFAILPFWLGTGTFTFFRAFRFFRVFRIFRFLRYSSRYLGTSFNKSSTIENIFIAKILFSISLFLYVSSALIYEIEGAINPNIHNFGDAIYFILICVSTVGFGDIVPVTIFGKMIVMITVLAGLIIVPWHTGSLVKNLSVMSSNRSARLTSNLEEDLEDLEEKIEEGINYCPHCGKKVKH